MYYTENDLVAQKGRGGVEVWDSTLQTIPLGLAGFSW